MEKYPHDSDTEKYVITYHTELPYAQQIWKIEIQDANIYLFFSKKSEACAERPERPVTYRKEQLNGSFQILKLQLVY